MKSRGFIRSTENFMQKINFPFQGSGHFKFQVHTTGHFFPFNSPHIFPENPIINIF